MLTTHLLPIFNKARNRMGVDLIKSELIGPRKVIYIWQLGKEEGFKNKRCLVMSHEGKVVKGRARLWRFLKMTFRIRTRMGIEKVNGMNFDRPFVGQLWVEWVMSSMAIKLNRSPSPFTSNSSWIPKWHKTSHSELLLNTTGFTAFHY